MVFRILCILVSLNICNCLPFNDYIKLMDANKILTSNSVKSNIFIWNKQFKDFLSFSNESLRNVTKPLQQNNTIILEPMNLENKTLRVTVELLYPYLTYNNSTQKLSGLLGEIWNVCEEYLKFKTNFSFVDDIQNITNKTNFDVLLSSEILFNSEYEYYNYSHPYYHPEYNIYQIVGVNPSSTYFLNSFKAMFWYCCLAVFVIFTITLWMNIYIINKVYKKHNKELLEPSLSIITCFLITLTGIFNQGIYQELSATSTRAQFFIIMTFGYTVYTALNAMLVRELATFSLDYPSNDDMIVRTLPICIPDNIIVHARMKADNYTLNGPGCPDITDPQSIKDSLCKKDATLVQSEAFMKAPLEDINWDCYIYGTNDIWFEYNSIVFTKRFKEKQLIIKFLEKLRSNGVLNKYIIDWVRLREFAQDKNNNCNSKYEEVTFTHIKGVLYAYFLSIILSWVILFIECIMYRLTKKTKIKNQSL